MENRDGGFRVRIKFPNIDEEVLKWLRQRDMPTEDNKMEIERL